MFSDIERVISNTPNGIKIWRNHVNQVFSEFHGNELGQRKGDAFAARLLNLKNANTLFRQPSSPEACFKAAEARVSAICNRSGDSVAGEGYYDFFQPLLLIRMIPGNDPALDNQLDELGVFTVVYFDQESLCVEVRQSLKFRFWPSQDQYQFEDARMAEHRGLPCVKLTGNSAPLHIEGLSVNGTPYLDQNPRGAIERNRAELDRLKAQGHLYNDALYISLLRCVQTLEMDRIVEAIGRHPRMNCMDQMSGNELFTGDILYR